MHRLYLLRHAEAAQGAPGTADFERPLTPRGRHDAAALGQRMRGEMHPPALVLCSRARRAWESWEALAHALPPPSAEVHHLGELYRGDAAEYMTLVAALAGPEPVLVVGHNPAIQELSHLLVGGSPAVASGFPPGALAAIDFAEPLSQIAPRRGRLAAFLPPSG